MKLTYLFILAIALSISIEAEGAKKKKYPPFMCRSPQELDEITKDCNDNIEYAEAAVLCLRKLEELVDTETNGLREQMAASNRAHVSKQVNSQTNSMGGASANYNLSIATLERLIDSAKQAKQQVQRYIKDIYVPEEFGLVEHPDFDIDDILLGEPCYAENQETLMMVEQDIYQIIDDLEAAKSMSGSLDKKVRSKKSKQKSNTKDAAQVTEKLPRRPAAQSNKKSSNPRSKITGIEEDRKKRSEQNQ